MRFVLLPLFIFSISVAFSAQAKMYKWIDDEGQMHFGDRIPAKYLSKKHEEINSQGITTRRTEAVKTEAERAAEKGLFKERQAAALAEKKKKQRDRVLLDTYTTDADLIAARDSRLEAVDTQIRLAKSIIAESSKKIESLENNVIAIKASNRAVPDDIYKRIERQKRQIKTHTKVMQKHIERRDDIAIQFEEYIERFKVLKAEQRATRERIARERAGLPN